MTEENDMAIRRNAKSGEQVCYVGANIGYIPGVPMKDMDADEWNALDGDLRKNAIRAGLYQLGGPEDAAEEMSDIGTLPPAEPPVEPAVEKKGRAPRVRAAHDEEAPPDEQPRAE